MQAVTDIDIDVADRDQALVDLQHIPASRLERGELRKHIVGVYFQSIPVDPLTGFSSVPYKEAEARGYFKIDLLNLSIYKEVRDEAHLEALLLQEPLWELLESEEVVNQLFHINNHFSIVQTMKPRSLMQLAMVLAMIRPAKRHLVGKTWEEVEADIWAPVEGEQYAFKKSHSLSYAAVLLVQMNLLLEQMLALPDGE